MEDEILARDHNQNNRVEGLQEGLTEQRRRSGVVARTLEMAAVGRIGKVFDLLDWLELSDDDTDELERALLAAALRRKQSPDQPILSLISEELRQAESAMVAEPEHFDDGQVPDFTAAPRDTFRGVRVDGDPYEFVMRHYKPWLQDGRKCLDRPMLGELDAKLLKALQQKASRSQGDMPDLAEIFPGKKEARANQLRFMKSAA